MKRGMGVVAGSRRRTGVAAVMAGLFIFAGQGGQLVFGSPSRLVDVLFVVLGGTGLIALGVFCIVLGALGLAGGTVSPRPSPGRCYLPRAPLLRRLGRLPTILQPTCKRAGRAARNWETRVSAAGAVRAA